MFVDAIVDPVVNRATLHQDIALLQMNNLPVDVHVNGASHHYSVINGFGSMVSRCNTRVVLNNSKYCAFFV